MLTIKERFVHKFERKTGQFTKSVNLFAKYQVGDITQRNSWRTIEVKGPKQNFILCECQKPLKVFKYETGNYELPLFFVMGKTNVTKIQGANFFALDGDTLIPYRSNGYGCVEEL
jgi:hypothetical protein